MDQNLLNKYFKNQCTTSEKELVESWLLDTNNKTEFDDYVLRKWDTFDEHSNKKRSSRKLWWIAAACLALITSAPLIMNVSNKQQYKITSNQEINDTISHFTETALKPSVPTVDVKTKQTIPYENKPIQPQTIATVDSSHQKSETKSIKASRVEKFMINEVQLAKLATQLDTTSGLIVDIKANEASFSEIAFLLKKQYGILLEPCNSSIPTKTYTAKLEKISIPDLLNDMAEKMLFSYTIEKDKIKICFN